MVGVFVPPCWLSGLEERRSSVLEFWRWKSEVGEAVEGEGRGGLAVGVVGALGCGVTPNGAGEGGAGEGEGEGEGQRPLGGRAAGEGWITCWAGGGRCVWGRGGTAGGGWGTGEGPPGPGAGGYMLGIAGWPI